MKNNREGSAWPTSVADQTINLNRTRACQQRDAAARRERLEKGRGLNEMWKIARLQRSKEQTQRERRQMKAEGNS